MRPYRLLVTGSRKTTSSQAAYVYTTLTTLMAGFLTVRQPFFVVQGKCPDGGVDLAAEQWADDHPGQVALESYPADWARLGRAAGPARNARMVAAGADLCVAFPAPGSKGTWDCVQKAADAGIEVRIFPLAKVR